MKILVLGDQIEDVYRHFTASRLCPEGPVPVLVKTKEKYSTPGGAGLVANQLRELFADSNKEIVTLIPGTHSIKERIFADDRLMLRIDEDATAVADLDYLKRFDLSIYNAIVVSDYGKGSFTHALARWLILTAAECQVPVFVDAKNSWDWYWGCFAMFPNKTEQNYHNFRGTIAKHIINKLGPDGCRVDGTLVPTKNHLVRDVTGAGDVFLAAFVYEYFNNLPCFTEPIDKSLQEFGFQKCARFANKVAGISVGYVGTHVVTEAEINAAD